MGRSAGPVAGVLSSRGLPAAPKPDAMRGARSPPGGPVTMGLVTALFGVTARAIRLYEDAALIHPARDSRNRRVYGPEERARLEIIILLRKADAGLDQIRAVLAGPRAEALGQAAELLDAQAVRLEAQLREVRAVSRELASRRDR